jgi:hypothetical protein
MIKELLLLLLPLLLLLLLARSCREERYDQALKRLGSKNQTHAKRGRRHNLMKIQ